MSLSLVNLDATTRQLMESEVDSDISAGKLYTSQRLSTIGQRDYPNLLKQAIQSHDDSWLAVQLNSNGRLNTTEKRNTKNGIIDAKVPSNAHEMMAEGEFNRFYIRGLCLRAIQNNIPNLIVYRAKVVSDPRPDSQAKVGSTVSPQSLLNDLRSNIGIDTALGLPAGPNSGLSVKLP